MVPGTQCMLNKHFYQITVCDTEDGMEDHNYTITILSNMDFIYLSLAKVLDN